MVSTLVALGEDVNELSNATGGGRHPLMVAARAGQWQCVQVLIGSGAEPSCAEDARAYAKCAYSPQALERADAINRIDDALRWRADWDKWPAGRRRRTTRRKRNASVWEEGCLTH